MFRGKQFTTTTGLGRIGIRLLAFVLLLFAAFPTLACTAFGGVIDGDVLGTPPSGQVQIDSNCTIRNWPASNPLTTNFSFYTQPGQNPQRWLVVFDNVVHTGNMSCNAVLEHKIWFTNGSSSSIQTGCQNQLIPVEKIDKQNPSPYATVGVPFTYSFKIPVLFDAATGTVVDTSGSVNTLHSIVITDDLNALGVDLTYLSHNMYWLNSGTPVPHSFSNVGGLLTFDLVQTIPAGEQVVLELTVVLDDTPTNAPGTQFTNTAKWEFGRLIDGVFYDPLPGEWGVTTPMTISAPNLVTTKTGPATLNLGQWGNFTLDIENAGFTDAWDATIVDLMPDIATGGTCDLTPEVLSAQVFASDGITPVSAPLVQGTDFSFNYVAAPTCRLTLTMLTAATKIGPGERLIINYRSKLDPDTQNGATLINVAGVTRWFNGDSSNTNRQTYNRTLTNGTVGTDDHEDAHTVAALLSAYFYEKTVENLTSGQNPATVAVAGDQLRYTLRLQTTDAALNNFAFYDELDALNAPPGFEPNTLAIVGPLPVGAVDNSDPTGGANGTGVIDISNMNLPAWSEVSIQFVIDVSSTATIGNFITNQAQLLVGGAPFAVSDDPNVSGQADPFVAGDEDPTQVEINLYVPPTPLKQALQPSATIGELFTYRITVPQTPPTVTLYDVRIQDDLSFAATGADLQFVSLAKVSGPGTPQNIGTGTDLIIAEDATNGIDIPAGQQLTVDVTVRLLNTVTNEATIPPALPMTYLNAASYTFNGTDNDDTTSRSGGTSSTVSMTVVEPRIALTKTWTNVTAGKLPGDPPAAGDILQYQVTADNTGDSTAYDINVVDTLPAGVALYAGFTPTATINAAPVAGFVSAPAGAPAGPLVWGRDNGDENLDVPAGQSLVLTYQIEVQIVVDPGGLIENSVLADWTSLDGTDASERTGAGCPTITPPDDYCTGPVVASATGIAPVLEFRKTVINDTTTQNPGTNASPGDTLIYQIQVRNLSATPANGFSLVDELDQLNSPPVFAPGSLALLTYPGTADITNTDPNGGGNGTGLVDIRNLSVGVAGSATDTITIEFRATLAPVITNGTAVLNQARLMVSGVQITVSDDPNVNGPDNPAVIGDEDPTRTVISSAPAFNVLKTSQDLTGDPNILLAGETLRYTFTVQNIGNENAVNVTLSDLIPANTSYVANSTTLNGAPVADPSAGVSALQNGLLIHAPENPTPGVMRAEAGGTTNIATVTFDVVVSPTVADGTIIANQGFLTGAGVGSGPFPEVPSDDPATPVLNDPTLDVVGNVPLLLTQKTVQIQVDGSSPGILDPLDTLRYTITIVNTAATPATGVVLSDPVPANTTYVAGSAELNSSPVAGVSPPVLQIPIGTLGAGATAVVTFDVQVNLGVASGTLISNQGSIDSNELPTQLTDADGNPSNGYQPTVIVVGNAQQLAISKQVIVVGGGAALAGGQLEYVVSVNNVGTVPATNVVITDDLNPLAGVATYVAGSGALNGASTGVTFAGGVLTGDYSSTYGNLAAGATATLRFRVDIDPSLPIGTRITNTGQVDWDSPAQNTLASVSIDLGGVPGAANLNGRAWHDANFNNTFDSGELALAGWSVDVYRGGVLVTTVTTASDGTYQVIGLAPYDTTAEFYEIRFRAPGAGANTALLGLADSAFTNALQQISDILAPSGSNLQNLNLPIDPNGVVYDSLLRTPVAGATLTLRDASGAALPSSCFVDAAQQGQVTLSSGYYKFDLSFQAACPAGADYIIEVTAPPTGYTAAPSQIIPPTTSAATAPLSVPTCPGGANDAIPATNFCEAQVSEFAPSTAVPPRTTGTNYYLYVTLSDGLVPQESQIFNNHIPIDGNVAAAIAITKTTPLINVSRAGLVPYTITIKNTLAAALQDLTLVDMLPPGFKYVKGSSRFDGKSLEPTWNGRQLRWPSLSLLSGEQHTLKLLLIVGSGVGEGKYVNRAQVKDTFTGENMSGEASATVRVVPDPTFDCTDVIGKVFDDANLNEHQDENEKGIGGVRVVSVRGLMAKTDEHGRFHITCAAIPNEVRGSNFILKVDDRSLPVGYRLTTENPLVHRLTRGKAIKFNFGATLHRVVRLDIAEGVFEPGATTVRPQWMTRFGLLLEELRKAPSILRISYLADVEDPSLVRARLNAVKKEAAQRWAELDCCYALTIETETFWRRGAPPARSNWSRLKRLFGDENN